MKGRSRRLPDECEVASVYVCAEGHDLPSNMVAKTNHGKSPIQYQIEATDKQIDQLVYELYGLTKEEVRIVEEVTKSTLRDKASE